MEPRKSETNVVSVLNVSNQMFVSPNLSNVGIERLYDSIFQFARPTDLIVLVEFQNNDKNLQISTEMIATMSGKL